jgi:hypothetical protein
MSSPLTHLLTLLTFTSFFLPIANARILPLMLTVDKPRIELNEISSKIILTFNQGGACAEIEAFENQAHNQQSILKMKTTDRPISPVMAGGTYTKRNLKGYHFELNPSGRLQLFVKHGVPQTAKVKCLGNNLIVEVVERYKIVESSETLARGLKYVRYNAVPKAGMVFRTHNLEWTPRGSNVKLTPLMPDPNSLRGLRTVKSTLSLYDGIAGVNASFFNANLKIPLGLVLKDGELLNGSLFNRVALGLDAQNKASIAQVELTGLIKMGRWTQSIEIVNMPRSDGTQIALYSQMWGSQSPPAGGGNIAIRLRNGRLHEVSSAGTLAIEGSNDWVLYGSSANLEPLASAEQGTSVEVLLSTVPDWSDKTMIVAGGPTLLKGGEPYIDLEAQRFGALPPNQKRPRTAIGVHPNEMITLMVVDSSPQGATLRETAELLALFGATEGMNLDGGASTQMVVKGRIPFATIQGGAAVSTVLGFVPTLPWPSI